MKQKSSAKISTQITTTIAIPISVRKKLVGCSVDGVVDDMVVAVVIVGASRSVDGVVDDMVVAVVIVGASRSVDGVVDDMVVTVGASRSVDGVVDDMVVTVGASRSVDGVVDDMVATVGPSRSVDGVVDDMVATVGPSRSVDGVVDDMVATVGPSRSVDGVVDDMVVPVVIVEAILGVLALLVKSIVTFLTINGTGVGDDTMVPWLFASSLTQVNMVLFSISELSWQTRMKMRASSDKTGTPLSSQRICRRYCSLELFNGSTSTLATLISPVMGSIRNGLSVLPGRIKYLISPFIPSSVSLQSTLIMLVPTGESSLTCTALLPGTNSGRFRLPAVRRITTAAESVLEPSLT